MLVFSQTCIVTYIFLSHNFSVQIIRLKLKNVENNISENSAETDLGLALEWQSLKNVLNRFENAILPTYKCVSADKTL